ncbi:hypothetical protein ABT025_25950 [Streptomyces sp. NPDC002809]|uniref:hypothetical protein n=1 Tax=Streptomyces sp. NPDC002809 TaxID=3154433 RepID=UPI00331A619B
MPEIAQWLRDWHAAHEQALRSRGISSAVKRPAPGTPSRGRPKATAVSLTMESDERTGMVLLWESGATSLLFIDTATEHTWQDRQTLTSENDLPRILAPLVKLVEAAAVDGGRRTS